jgi:DNA polymerase I-like protein with 3'-5' exonuclease and polymerase domains
MRFDSIGMFWQDEPASRKRGATIGPRPEVPETGWTTPTEYPNLSAAKAIALDTETYDPELTSAGPGWARGVGNICGVSLAVQNGSGSHSKWYFPIRHTDSPEQNMCPEKTLRWLNHTLSRPHQPKIGANLSYDIGWLRHEGVNVCGPFYDVSFAEALLDEAARVGLDVLGKKYLGIGKETSLLYQWCSDYYGGPPNEKQRKNIYRSPPSLVGPYAEEDAALPLQIMEKQWPLLLSENLLPVFELECKLLPLMIDMRFAGVTVDVDRAHQLYDKLGGEVDTLQENIRNLVGFSVNCDAAASIARAFDARGIPYGKTAKGNPSFTADFLKTVSDPLAESILEIKQREKIRGTFLKSYIIDNAVNGKVHGSFNQLRGDGTGARSGRFSSDSPNLQNIPVRSELGKKIRRLFLKDEGHVAWRKYDYSQIEYRFLAHYAVDNGDGSAERVRQTYRNDPNVDYHQLIHDLIFEVTGIDLKRGHTKNMNFGLIYGMGVPKLIQQLGVETSKGKELFAAYHKGAPFVKATMDAAMREVQTYGVMPTVLGRKSRFDLWEPDAWGKVGKAVPYEQALLAYGKVKRAYGHKGLNRKLQGSAADLMKKAMVDCYESGVFEETGVPRLTVHDELDFSDPGGKDEAFKEVKHIMETCLTINVPITADFEIGPNWGDVV